MVAEPKVNELLEDGLSAAGFCIDPKESAVLSPFDVLLVEENPNEKAGVLEDDCVLSTDFSVAGRALLLLPNVICPVGSLEEPSVVAEVGCPNVIPILGAGLAVELAAEASFSFPGCTVSQAGHFKSFFLFITAHDGHFQDPSST